VATQGQPAARFLPISGPETAMHTHRPSALPHAALAASLLLALAAVPATAQPLPGPDDPVAYAESAGIPEIASEATILDAEMNVLRQGTNGWTCMAIPGAPMCVDEQWMSWLDAYVNQRPQAVVTGVGIAYMLRGDEGASNIHPYDTEPNPENEWVATGPHLMLIVPDPALLAGLPTDPAEGGPYVMWRGNHLVHVMIPVEPGTIELYRPDGG
jgi:hypothetical protein